MGRNKDIRKQIAGHERNIRKHMAKIEAELLADRPDQSLVNKWRRDIRRDEARIELLNRRLVRRRSAYKKRANVS